jgi:hypothetical protein
MTIDMQDNHEISNPNIICPRTTWTEQLKAMAEAGDDRLVDPPVATQWEEEEWEWAD